MSRTRYLALNALSMLIANIFSKIVLFIGMIFLLQYLDAGEESIYYLVTAFAMVIAVNFQDGMVVMTIRRIATDIQNGPREMGTLYLATSVLALVLAAITFIASFVYAGIQFEGENQRIEFIQSAMALTGAFLVGYGYAVAGAGFKAYEKLWIESILLALQSIFSAGVYWYGATHQWPLPYFFYGLFITTAFHSTISFIVLYLFIVKPKFHSDFRSAYELFAESLQLGFASLLRVLQERIHPFLINIPSLAGQSYITQWSSPNNLFAHFKFIPLSIRPAMFPTLARKAELETDEFQVYSLALMKFLYLLALPLLITMSIARHEVLPLITTMEADFSETYAFAIMVAPLVAWSIALSFPSQVLRTLFVALKKPQYEFRTVLAGLCVLVVLDILLLPEYKVMGAGIASISAELTILIYGLWLLNKLGRGIKLSHVFLLPTLCGMITHLSAEFLYRELWIYGILGVIVVFPILLLIFRVISPVEWSILREMFMPSKPAFK
mgnify:CR=1 FL=1